MESSWSDIAAFLDELATDFHEPAFRGVERLAIFIANGRLNQTLFGWTSMHTLCIQQVDQPPYSGPYLRVAPMKDGMVEFRYLDTAIPERQWHRTVPAEETVSRFEKFLDQLHWVARQSPPAE